MHSRLPSEMWESEAGSHVHSRQRLAARGVDSTPRLPMNGLFRALQPRGLSGGLISLAAAIALLYYGRLFLVTLCTAVIINFILEPFVGLLIRVRVPRALASFIVCSLAVCAVYLAGLGVYRQGATLVENVPKYAQRIGDLSDGVMTKLESMEQAAYALVVPKRPSQPAQKNPPAKKRRTPEPLVPATPSIQEVRIRPERPPIADFIHSHLGSLYNTLLLASFVPFLVYFMLSWRDHIQPAFLQLFEGPDRIVGCHEPGRHRFDGPGIRGRQFPAGPAAGRRQHGFLLGVSTAISDADRAFERFSEPRAFRRSAAGAGPAAPGGAGRLQHAGAVPDHRGRGGAVSSSSDEPALPEDRGPARALEPAGG